MRRTDGRDAIDRDYLSISEVLDLLVTEFPEITISKIRFLESRGLIRLERTPSGYRKFYEGDVSRLRWILQQQREHFLPLKVIKGRLDGENDAHGRTSAPSLFDSHFEAAVEMHERLVPVSASQLTHGEDGAVSASSPLGLPHHDDGLTARRVLGDGAAPRGSLASEVAPQKDEERAEPATKAVDVATVAENGSAPKDVSEEPAKPPSAPSAASKRADISRAAEMAGLASASLSLEELSGASGAPPELVRELMAYGLITHREVGGEVSFDDDALVLSRIAARFAAFGIEPRHLRSLKHGAERDATLFGQAVVPLLRQRNPEARTRAQHDLDELTTLGTDLHRMLLAIELRSLTGG